MTCVLRVEDFIMLVQGILPIGFSKKCSPIVFKSATEQTSQPTKGLKDDSYYDMRAEMYMDMYYQCGAAGCDDEETVEYYQQQMDEIEKEFKAANRRIRDHIYRKQDADDI